MGHLKAWILPELARLQSPGPEQWSLHCVEAPPEWTLECARKQVGQDLPRAMQLSRTAGLGRVPWASPKSHPLIPPKLLRAHFLHKTWFLWPLLRVASAAARQPASHTAMLVRLLAAPLPSLFPADAHPKQALDAQ